MSRSTLIIKLFGQHIFFFYVPVSNKNEKKKEKDLYKNENDKISTERESEKERYTFYMRLSCVNIYTHILSFVFRTKRKKSKP